ncbi:MAG: DNA polymerase III subunit delta [Treponema sp.]|jgi:DNA polymerase-3 subunit delta|nr:DNA polymerase III subunit delta [Treponema sp.]
MSKGICHLFLGPEFGEKRDAIDRIRRDLTAQFGVPAEETSFYAGETPVNDMVAALRNGSLFADSRLFFIKNAEALKKKADLELLASYMASPQDDTTLILMSDTVSLDKTLEKAAGGGKKVFWELFENKKTEWVSNFFRREGFRINDEGINAILELVENNTDSLRRECSRLMLFLGKDTVVGETEVENWLAHTREESAFTLFSRIAEGDLTRSVEILHTLLAAKEAPVAILAALASCFRKVRDYAALTAAGASDEFEYKKIGVGSAYSRTRKDYAAAGKRYGVSGAGACLALTADFDLRVRSSGAGFEQILMDQYLYEIIRKAR